VGDQRSAAGSRAERILSAHLDLPYDGQAGANRASARSVALTGPSIAPYHDRRHTAVSSDEPHSGDASKERLA